MAILCLQFLRSYEHAQPNLPYGVSDKHLPTLRQLVRIVHGRSFMVNQKCLRFTVSFLAACHNFTVPSRSPLRRSILYCSQILDTFSLSGFLSTIESKSHSITSSFKRISFRV